MLTAKVFLMILMSGTYDSTKPAFQTLPMQPDLSVREQSQNCERLAAGLLEQWKNDPVISKLNVSLTCISTVPTDIDY